MGEMGELLFPKTNTELSNMEGKRQCQFSILGLACQPFLDRLIYTPVYWGLPTVGTESWNRNLAQKDHASPGKI
jgi:hypothetical protein